MRFVFLLFSMCVSIPQIEKPADVYIFEYGSKIIGQATIGFVFINDASQHVETFYKIYYNKNKIKKIRRYTDIFNRTITKNGSGILIEEARLACYDGESFKMHTRYSYSLYKLLDNDFLAMNNDQRYEVLENLVKKISVE